MHTVEMDTTHVTHLAGPLRFPEGPAFAPDGSLWLVELKGGSLVRFSDGSLQRFHVGGAPNGIAIDKKGHIWFCDSAERSIRRFDPMVQEIITIASNVHGEVLDKPNDLAFDSKENLVFTCPGESRKEPTGYACVLSKEGFVKKITTGKYFPNGLAFTADGEKLVIAETYKHRLWIGDWNQVTLEWQNERVWCDIGGPDGPGGPDGMAFHPDGYLYVAVYGTGEIRVVDEKGQVIEKIGLPAHNPTNCAFDPAGKLGLVVTEAETGVLLSVDIKNYKTSKYKDNECRSV